MKSVWLFAGSRSHSRGFRFPAAHATCHMCVVVCYSVPVTCTVVSCGSNRKPDATEAWTPFSVIRGCRQALLGGAISERGFGVRRAAELLPTRLFARLTPNHHARASPPKKRFCRRPPDQAPSSAGTSNRVPDRQDTLPFLTAGTGMGFFSALEHFHVTGLSVGDSPVQPPQPSCPHICGQ